MNTDRQLIARLLELQEHPEQVTDEQLQQALDDPQMRELVEQMAFAKRTFKDEELQAAEPDVEGEWERFATKRSALPLCSAKNFDEGNETRHGYPFMKMAASFIGILLVSGMAFAAIHIVRMVNSHKAETVQTEQPASYKPSSVLPADTVKTDTTTTEQPVVFDNVPLEKMLTEIASYYDTEVSFRSEEARQLRFHFVWKREDGLGHAIEKLNRFESLNVRLDENIIIVE